MFPQAAKDYISHNMWGPWAAAPLSSTAEKCPVAELSVADCLCDLMRTGHSDLAFDCLFAVCIVCACPLNPPDGLWASRLFF